MMGNVAATVGIVPSAHADMHVNYYKMGQGHLWVIVKTLVRVLPMICCVLTHDLLCSGPRSFVLWPAICCVAARNLLCFMALDRLCCGPRSVVLLVLLGNRINIFIVLRNPFSIFI
jgi:hypothetical protein